MWKSVGSPQRAWVFVTSTGMPRAAQTLLKLTPAAITRTSASCGPTSGVSMTSSWKAFSGSPYRSGRMSCACICAGTSPIGGISPISYRGFATVLTSSNAWIVSGRRRRDHRRGSANATTSARARGARGLRAAEQAPGALRPEGSVEVVGRERPARLSGRRVPVERGVEDARHRGADHGHEPDPDDPDRDAEQADRGPEEHRDGDDRDHRQEHDDADRRVAGELLPPALLEEGRRPLDRVDRAERLVEQDRHDEERD